MTYWWGGFSMSMAATCGMKDLERPDSDGRDEVRNSPLVQERDPNDVGHAVERRRLRIPDGSCGWRAVEFSDNC